MKNKKILRRILIVALCLTAAVSATEFINIDEAVNSDMGLKKNILALLLMFLNRLY